MCGLSQIADDVLGIETRIPDAPDPVIPPPAAPVAPEPTTDQQSATTPTRDRDNRTASVDSLQVQLVNPLSQGRDRANPFRL